MYDTGRFLRSLNWRQESYAAQREGNNHFWDKSITFEGPADFVKQQVERYAIPRQGTQGTEGSTQQNRSAGNPVQLGRSLPPTEDSVIRGERPY